MSKPDPYLFDATRGQLVDFIEKIIPQKNILGIDPGEKKIGLAISDHLLKIAMPLITLERKSLAHDLAKIAEIIEQRAIGGLVCGLPLQMNGTAGKSAENAIKLAQQIIAKVKLPVLLWDERLSTSAVEQFLIKEADLSRKKRAKVIDRSAAAFILQGALDAIHNKKLSG